MSLGGSVTYWDRARKNANSKETWLVRLYFDDEGGSDYLGLCDQDITIDTTFYHGLIIDFGELTEKLDLLKSKAAIGNVDITCTNNFKNLHFTKELWPTNASSLYHINRKVNIYSKFGDTTNIADCRLIYEGRLFNLSSNQDTVTLHIEQKSPQDFIKIPNTKSNDGKVYFPVTYGNYSDTTAYAYPANYALHPIPVHSVQNDQIYCLDSVNQAHNWHHYEKNIDRFVKMNTTGNAATAYQGGYASLQDADCARNLRVPIFERASDADFTDPELSADNDTTDYAYVDDHGLAATSDILYCDIPTLEGVFTALTIDLYGYINNSSAGSEIIAIRDASFGKSPADDFFSQSGAGTLGPGWSAGGPYDLHTEYVAQSEVADRIQINVYWSATSANGTARIYDIDLRGTIEFDKPSGDPPTGVNSVQKSYEAYERQINSLEFLYSSTDGYNNDFNTSTRSGSTAIYCHEIFRDMLDRFAGFDVSDANWTNYTALHTARTTTNSTWDARLWLTEPEQLTDVLERLQFEGGFIFKYHPSGAKYIYVKDSYATGDTQGDLTIAQYNITKNDYQNLENTLTDFSEIVTDVTYRYTRHPKKNDFVNSRTYTNSTARTNYWPSIATEENKAQINLKYLVDDPYESGTDTTANDCIALYYDNIWGDPKIIVSCDLVNPVFFDLEIGDIVTFNENYVNMGKTTTVFYMVIETRRSLGSLSIVAREVYDA